MDDLTTLVDRLSADKKLSVWSVIISFFGDAIVPRGGAVSASTVQQVLNHIGFEAGAVRTAFSRLTRDGWVVREKKGRSSFYRLSPEGSLPFEEATARIYAAQQKPLISKDPWTLAIKNSKPFDYKLLHNIDRSDMKELASNEFLVLTGKIECIPQWLRNEIAPPELAAAFERLNADFLPIQEVRLGELDSLAVRCLLVHEWRRLILRTADIPGELLPPEWPLERTRTFVASFYHRLLMPSENWLSTEGCGPDGALPKTLPAIELRFK